MNTCTCYECKTRKHDSDCAVHNEPATPKGDCDCDPGNGWISCEDKLPETSGIYLACSVKEGRKFPEDIIDMLCSFDAEAGEKESKWQHSSGFYDNGITHWLYPQPPTK